jgi:hypothetical protein
MKKAIFSILAISLLATTAVNAGKGKTSKKHIAKKECSVSCQCTDPCTGSCCSHAQAK